MGFGARTFIDMLQGSIWPCSMMMAWLLTPSQPAWTGSIIGCECVQVAVGLRRTCSQSSMEKVRRRKRQGENAKVVTLEKRCRRNKRNVGTAAKTPTNDIGVGD